MLGQALVLVGTMDQPRVEGAVSGQGYLPLTPIDPEMIPEETMGVAVVDPALFGADPRPALELINLKLGDTPLVLLSGPCTRATMATMVGLPTVTGIVARDHVLCDDELHHVLACVRRGPCFGFEDQLAPGTVVLERQITGSADRDPALAAVDEFASERRVRRRIRGMLQDIADELITNAVYDAPVDEAGVPLYASLDRRESVELGSAARPVLRVASDGARAAVAIEDPYGSLRLGTVRRYLSKGLAGGPDQLDAKVGGAGLGLTRVLELSDRLTIKVMRARRTEVVALVELGGARRDTASRPTSVALAEAFG